MIILTLCQKITNNYLNIEYLNFFSIFIIRICYQLICLKAKEDYNLKKPIFIRG